jgi:hypothetical protein
MHAGLPDTQHFRIYSRRRLSYPKSLKNLCTEL